MPDSYQQIKEQFEALLDNSPDGIWISDGQGVVLRVNRAAQENSGFKSEDIIGKSIYQIIEEAHIEISATAKALETKNRQSVLEHKKNTGRTLLITATPIFDSTGDLSLIIANERDITQLNTIENELMQKRLETERVKEELTELHLRQLGHHEIIAASKKMEQVLMLGLKLARLGVSNILITGESGTGKGLLAGYIHRNSKRHKKSFLHINCAAIPDGLIEAELFGYEKGAFTGARETGKPGLFEIADGGTLFLDEIGDLPKQMQAKLLTYLDNHQVTRIGGLNARKVNCTIIAATNRDLKSDVKEKRFRKDLFFRLNAFVIKIPPLRSRPDDILELMRFFLSKYNKEFGQKKCITQKTIDAFLTHPLPGNVRELKNALKTAVVLSDDEVLDGFLLKTLAGDTSLIKNGQNDEERITDLKQAVEAVEKIAFQQALKHCRSTRQIAKYLNVSQTKVVRSLRKHGLTDQLMRK